MLTPGPWAWKRSETGWFVVYSPQRVGGTENGVVTELQFQPVQEAEGNARAIAAVPEMIDLLRRGIGPVKEECWPRCVAKLLKRIDG